MALESIMPKMLMVDNIVAMATGELTNTFSEAGPFPPTATINPKSIRIPKYAQVAGRLSRYWSSNRNISLNIIDNF
jgi:hypothetical protein